MLFSCCSLVHECLFVFPDLRHAQSLAAVKAYVTWLAQYHVEAPATGEQRQDCNNMLTAALEAILPLHENQVRGRKSRLSLNIAISRHIH